MSKIDRYEMQVDKGYYCADRVTPEQHDTGDWCKYEDVKELIEKLESRIDTLQMQVYSRNNHKCIGNLPY